MSHEQHRRFGEADLDDLPPELIELGKLLADPAQHDPKELNLCYQRVVESIKRRRRIMGLVQEALSQLRLDVKYLMFDLEMTRRERDDLRAQTGEEDAGS
jgi:hypothetical protein